MDNKAYPQVGRVVVAMLAVPLTQNQVLGSVVLVRIHEQDSLHGSTLLQPIQLEVHSQSWKRERNSGDIVTSASKCSFLQILYALFIFLDFKRACFRLMSGASERHTNKDFRKHATWHALLFLTRIQSHLFFVMSKTVHGFKQASFQECWESGFYCLLV